MVEMDFLCPSPMKNAFLSDWDSVQFNFTIGVANMIHKLENNGLLLAMGYIPIFPVYDCSGVLMAIVELKLING